MSFHEDVRRRAILVALAPSAAELAETEIELSELSRLLDTAGGECVARMIQVRPTPDTATCIGSGKLEELRDLCKSEEAGLVVFNNELSPSQVRNIEDALDGVDVIDRTMLILDIFALHATSGEGKLQVELAQLKYTASRLIDSGVTFSRQEGRIGSRGPGESKLETNRRLVKHRAAALEAELRELAENRATMRAARERSGIPRIAIVGYTNAGKSTLLNSLTEAGVLSEDKLFATLDPTTRRLALPDDREVLLTDTVGFIRRLPHQLIRAFHSTLEEATHADLLLIVCDASDPECDSQLAVTEQLLCDLGAGDLPRVIVYNKCDLIEGFLATCPTAEGRVFLSARSGDGIPCLLEAISASLRSREREAELLFPYSELGAMNLLRGSSPILAEPDYREDGVLVKALLDEKNFNKYSRFILGQKDND
ncbi:MAG: GTPase HflX [Clostridia bacterium]|nr:GTPase HflX [Clostridia bacterium]